MRHQFKGHVWTVGVVLSAAFVWVLLTGLFAKPPLASIPVVDDGVTVIDPPDLCVNYPIKLTKSGSYRLDHGIDLAKIFCDKTAIEVDADFVTVDLNGHTIKGPCDVMVCHTNGCAVLLIKVPCVSSDGHNGIDVPASNTGTTVKNGTVTLMGDDGVHVRADGIIQGVRAVSNEGEGIQCGEGCLLSDDLANGNKGDGFEVDDDALVTNVVGQGNGGPGIFCDSVLVSVRGSVFTANTGGGIVGCTNTGGNLP
jgi:hypothetical protein